MAKYERMLTGDFDEFVSYCNGAVMNASSTATLEETSDLFMGSVRVAVRVYERYSMWGGNRVSLQLVVVGDQGNLAVTAMTSGGSQATFFKVNTLGEESFLDTIAPAIEQFAAAMPPPQIPEQY